MSKTCECQNKCGKMNCNNAYKQIYALEYLLMLCDVALQNLDRGGATSLNNISINTNLLRNLPYMNGTTGNRTIAPSCGTNHGIYGDGGLNINTNVTNFGQLIEGQDNSYSTAIIVYCIPGSACNCAFGSGLLDVCEHGILSTSTPQSQLGQFLSAFQHNTCTIKRYWESITRNC